MSSAPRRGRPHGFLSALPAAAFEVPILFGRSFFFWRYAVISDPAGVRRVLVENAANYPKTPSDIAFFAALFGGGLLGLDGDDWRRHRRIMAPAFDPRGVAGYGPALAATLREFLARWDTLVDGTRVDMAKEMTSLSLEAISRTVFSADGVQTGTLIRDMLTRAFESMNDANLLDLIPVIGGLRMKARRQRLAKAAAPLDTAIDLLLAERDSAGRNGPPDLISRLLAARDSETGVRLTGREIRDEIVTIYLAGHETTASTLTWTWYVLSQRPEVLAQVQAELDAVLGDQAPAPEDLPRLAYTRRVVEEAMRLFPAAPGLSSRRAEADDEICGVKIAKGTTVSIFPWVLHRHRRLWTEPETFDPDRFLPKTTAERPRFAYLPFGAGARVCIGQGLAMNEAILALATLAQRYSVSLAPDAKVVPVAQITLQLRHGLPMILKRRPAERPSASV